MMAGLDFSVFRRSAGKVDLSVCTSVRKTAPCIDGHPSPLVLVRIRGKKARPKCVSHL